jgi:hypothetical protein
MITKEELYEKHKDILAPRTHIDCEAGWNNLIDIAITLVANHPGRAIFPDLKFCTIKQKFGGLRLYTEFGGHRTDGAEPTDPIKGLEFAAFGVGVVKMAEALSYRTCEVTGNPGVLCQTPTRFSVWLQTLCAEQQAERGYTPYVPRTHSDKKKEADDGKPAENQETSNKEEDQAQDRL